MAAKVLGKSEIALKNIKKEKIKSAKKRAKRRLANFRKEAAAEVMKEQLEKLEKLDLNLSR